MSSRTLDARRVQVLDSDWFKTDHRAVPAVLSLKARMRYSAKLGVNLRGWKPDDSWQRAAAETLTVWGNWDVMAPLHLETAKAHKRMETKEMTVTELEVKPLLLNEKREGRNLERAELNWLCRAIWRKRRALKREKHLIKIGESAETGKVSPENTKQAFQLEFDCETRKSRSISHSFLPRTLLNSCGPRRHCPIRENSLDRAVEKLANGRCGWNADLNGDTGESLEQKNWEVFTGSDHSGCFESKAPGMSGKVDEIVVCDLLRHELLGGMAVLVDSCGTKSGGCNMFVQVRADRWAVCSWATYGLSRSLHCDTRVCRRRLCRKHTQMLVCSCCCKRQNYHENGRKKLW